MVCQHDQHVAAGVRLAINEQGSLTTFALELPPRIANLFDFFPTDLVLSLDLIQDVRIDVDGVNARQQIPFPANTV